MKLNPDIVRGVLLTVEEKTNFDSVWVYEKGDYESEYLAELTHNEIAYHIKQCDEAGLINVDLYADNGDMIVISDLSPAGHEFLAGANNSAIWQVIQEKATEIALPMILETIKTLTLRMILF